MSTSLGQPFGGESDWLTAQRKWARGWRGVVFPGMFLSYLLETAGAISKYCSGALVVAGDGALVLFSGCYIMAVRTSHEQSPRYFWARWGVMVALFVGVVPLAHANAFVMAIFIVVLTVARLGGRALPVVVLLTAAAVLLPSAVPSWHQSLSTGLDNGDAVAIPLVGLAMFSFFNVLKGNRSLAGARSEIARLAAENERSRIGRDLHDLLGHSLTTITVKSELARHLGQVNDISGAMREIGEVEELSRRALSDVRAAVGNYREVTLVGELATGRELLRAAGITADLPGAVDVVDQDAQELFGWVLREGLTNVVRHSRASLCTVRISRSSVEIVDDGAGDVTCWGNGLLGLRERVSAVGGVIEAGPALPKGWRVRVSVAPPELAEVTSP